MSSHHSLPMFLSEVYIPSSNGDSSFFCDLIHCWHRQYILQSPLDPYLFVSHKLVQQRIMVRCWTDASQCTLASASEAGSGCLPLRAVVGRAESFQCEY